MSLSAEQPLGAPLRLLIVEDNPLHAQALRLGLKQLGYVVLGVAATPAEARRLFRAEAPDLLLLDIHLALDADPHGDTAADGIELAAELLRQRPTPLIFLTSLDDEPTFRRAQQVAPAAFLLKPFDPDTLHRAIELAVVRASTVALAPDTPGVGAHDDGDGDGDGDSLLAGPVLCLLPDAIFVRHAGRLEHVKFSDVTHLTADRSYCDLFLASGARYALRTSLREVEERLPTGRFVRTHRSCVVSWAAIEAVDGATMEVRVRGGARLPLSRSYRDALVQALPQLG